MTTGRYAPSPSGRMHLGNLLCCLLAWLSAKSKGGQVLLRIEDLDAQRCPRVYADAIIDDLAWLGLAADGPRPPVYQSERSAIYRQYYDKLAARGLTYPCFCSRSQLHAASAPHRSDGQVVYAGTCRGLTPAQAAEKAKTKAPAWRVRVPDEEIAFVDGHLGPYAENLARDCGDFYLRRADEILRATLEEAGQNKPNTQAFAVLADFSSAFMDGTPRYVVILRAVNASGEGHIQVRRLPQDVLERAAERIVAQTPRVYRVVYDLTSVPPAHVEWE